MRENWARRLAALTGIVILVLAAAFAASRNLPGGADANAAADAGIERGKQVYQDQGCARCHSVAGVGSTRSRLDGVGARLSAVEIRGRAIGLADQQDFLPPAVFRAKQAYQTLAEDDLKALVAYIQSLR